MRLFCFPFAGGSASIYAAWSAGLPDAVQVCPVQLPGREDRLFEPPYIRLSSLIEALVPALIPDLDQPFAIFGHSMGALIGFELACALRRQGLPLPVRLYVSGFRAPHLPDSTQQLHALPDAEFLEGLRAYKEAADEVLLNPDLRQLLLPTLRADFALCETHRHGFEGALDCPIVAFGGLEDKIVRRDQLDAWRDLTSASFALQMLPGDHFFIQTAQSSLLNILSQDLALVIQQAAGSPLR